MSVRLLGLWWRWSGVAAVVWFGATASAQELRLHGLFTSHMVLPQLTEVVMPGRAEPAAVVEVAAPWLKAPVHGTAAGDGRFRIAVPTPAAGGPFQVTVRSGAREVVLDDVLVGDVWLGSGQSNMEMALGKASWSQGAIDWERDVAAAQLPQLRCCTVDRRIAASPADDLAGEGTWQVCSPATAAALSATAFYFGRELQRHRREPLGLVVSCWGGTVCEAWTRAVGLAAFPEFGPALQALRGLDAGTMAQLQGAYWATIAGLDPQVGGRSPAAAEFDASGWPTVVLPQPWSKSDLRDHDGVAWYRREVTIPDAWAGQPLLLQLGPIDDMDTVWFGGERIGGREAPGHWQEARTYEVPAPAVRSGRVAIAVRVLDTGGEGGFTGTAEAMRLSPLAGAAGAIDLSGPWQVGVGAPLARLPRLPVPVAGQPNSPTVLWNGMIAPLVPFPFRGVIWYQGESNRDRAAQYSRLFPAMIQDWRAAFGRELPFLFVQIAPFGYPGDRGESFDLRLAQEQALALPATGMAASTDVGDVADIHPRQKGPIGERLARLALAVAYGDAAIAAQSPRPTAARRVGDAVRVEFAATAGGLVGVGGATTAMPQHFEVAGADGVYRAAAGTIDGAAVVLHCAAVAAPTSVRYCHAATALADLWNGAGLPAVPFVVPIDP